MYRGLRFQSSFDKIYTRYPLSPPWSEKSAYIGTMVMLERFPFLSIPNLKVLDLGCGTGKNMELLSQRGYKTYGVDFSFNALRNARNQFNLSRLAQGDAIKLPFKNNSFDLVIDVGLLHCISPDKRAFIKAEVERVLKDGGSCLLSEFYRRNKYSFQKPIFYTFVHKIGKSARRIPWREQIPTWGLNLEDIELLFKKNFSVNKYFYYGDRLIVLMKKIT